jgi:hypothetical protein
LVLGLLAPVRRFVNLRSKTLAVFYSSRDAGHLGSGLGKLN